MDYNTLLIDTLREKQYITPLERSLKQESLKRWVWKSAYLKTR